jgi:hypothetical protein
MAVPPYANSEIRMQKSSMESLPSANSPFNYAVILSIPLIFLSDAIINVEEEVFKQKIAIKWSSGGLGLSP